MTVSPPERRLTHRLRDGRTLSWSEWGPQDGTPVLFCTGAAMSGTLGFGGEHLRPLGLRLIAPDRPGLGGSSPHDHKTLLTWVEDTRGLIEARSLHGALGVGFSQGAPFALALAAHGLVGALAIVAGQDDVHHPHTFSLLHPDVQAMVTAVRDDPVGFERDFSRVATLDGLWQLIMGMSSDVDLGVYRTEPFHSAYRECLREGFQQGPHGYVRDLVNALSPWPFALEDVTIPVDLWYGALDRSTVHSPDFGRTLAARLPNAELHLLAHEGGSLLWTRPQDVLQRLTRRSDAVRPERRTVPPPRSS